MARTTSIPKMISGKVDPWQKPTLRQILQRGEKFAVAVELVTSRGVIAERSGQRVLDLARSLSSHPEIDAMSITDNPGGNAMLGADVLGTDLISRGQEVIIHLACKDWNRNAIQSRGWELASAGFHNVLALSGDCPVSGFEGQASGVFDIDSVGLLKMFDDMNKGLKYPSRISDKMLTMKRTDFFLGTVVNNYKRYEREVMPQYFKLAKKLESGAGFVINQLGYDSRKLDELQRYMALKEMDVPVLANVYILSGRAAQFFHDGGFPGCFVNDTLFDLSQKHARSPDKGKSFFFEFAAKQVAIAKGLGFAGVYLGGHLNADEFARVLEIEKQFSADDWKTFARQIQYGHTDEFHYFEQDRKTSLTSNQVNRYYLASKTADGQKQARQQISLDYKLNRLVHNQVFKKGTKGFNAGRRISLKILDSSVGMQKIAHRMEHALKILSFDCRDCGDCSLPDIAYLCPESQCAKNQRNGPCGGTRKGKCEVGEKDCIWARAYDRLKAYGEEEQMLDRPVVYKNGALQGTSAWTNTFLERDHHSKNS